MSPRILPATFCRPVRLRVLPPAGEFGAVGASALAMRDDAVFEVLDGGVEVATLRVAAAAPGLFVVDAVARLELAARRLGWRVRPRDPDPDLLALFELAGLPLEPRREAERREQPGVEEVVQADQPPA